MRLDVNRKIFEADNLFPGADDKEMVKRQEGLPTLSARLIKNAKEALKHIDMAQTLLCELGDSDFGSDSSVNDVEDYVQRLENANDALHEPRYQLQRMLGITEPVEEYPYNGFRVEDD